MKLKCLGSGSSGNCYLLESDREALVIEAGISFAEVKKALNFNIKKIVGVIISHSHGDHAKFISQYKNDGIPVFAPYAEGKLQQDIYLGDFFVRSFDLVHDVPCCGYLISHPKIGRLLYASDTEYIKYRFSHLNHILVEANYAAEFVEINAVNRTHVLTGHMELRTTLEFLQANSGHELRNVILCHLSRDNADPEMFRQEAEKVVDAEIYIAEKGLCVDMSAVLF